MRIQHFVALGEWHISVEPGKVFCVLHSQGEVDAFSEGMCAAMATAREIELEQLKLEHSYVRELATLLTQAVAGTPKEGGPWFASKCRLLDIRLTAVSRRIAAIEKVMATPTGRAGVPAQEVASAD